MMYLKWDSRATEALRDHAEERTGCMDDYYALHTNAYNNIQHKVRAQLQDTVLKCHVDKYFESVPK